VRSNRCFPSVLGSAPGIVTTRVHTRIVSEGVLLFATLAAYMVWQLGAQIDVWYHTHYGFEVESFVTWGFAGIGAWGDMTAQVAGTTGMILYGMLLALFVTVPLRRLRLPAGAITTIILWTSAMICVATPELWIYLPAALAAALVGEALWLRIRRGSWGGPDGRAGYWLIAFAVPAAQLYTYFALMAAFGGGISWSTSLWTGAPLLAGIYGLIATAFAIPPRFVEAT